MTQFFLYISEDASYKMQLIMMWTIHAMTMMIIFILIGQLIIILMEMMMRIIADAKIFCMNILLITTAILTALTIMIIIITQR